MLADYVESLDALVPPGFAGDVGMASGVGALSVFGTLYTTQLLVGAIKDTDFVKEKPKLAFQVSALAIGALTVGASRLLYNHSQRASMAVAGAAVGSTLQALFLSIFLPDAAPKSLSEMVEGESQGLYPGNYAFP